MPISNATDIYSQDIKNVYTTLVVIYSKDASGTVTSDKIYLNDSGETLTFLNNTYIPAVFTVTEPDQSSVNEESGSFNIAGITDNYATMLQNAIGTIVVEVSLIKLSEASLGYYILEPVAYEASSATLNSATATLSLTLKSGGALAYYASKMTYTSITFPGING